ncbi:MAG TPA: aldolase/citrate lyase family protein [Xanthobacteraceae bacterium]|nr:aldolase/citrate lyase family protein [Xanthobacteraceae bacterium]
MASPEPFSLARRLRAGETVHVGWATLGVPILAEMLARDGFSAVNLDQQHGLFDQAGVIAGIAAVRAAGAAPIVRVPLGDFAYVSRVLDFGAEGVIAPMINTAEDARAFAAAAKFPPIGERSWGPARALMLNGLSMPDYLKQANDNVVTLAMVETRTALKNLDAILATPGIDGVFVGPSDLSIALSNGNTLDPHSKDVDSTCEAIVAAARKAGKIAGAYTAGPERANEQAARGFRFLAVGSDGAFMRAGTLAAVKGLKA